MPLPEAVAAVDRLKARLMALDEAAAAELIGAYTPIWGRLRREIDGILADVAERQMALDQALRLQRLHALQAQVEREMVRYTTVAVGTATNAQRAAVELAASGTRQAVAAALPPGVDMRLLGSIGIDWNMLPADAFEALVGIAGDGGPLRALLEPLGAVARDGIAQGLAEGIALGRGPRETAAIIRDRFGVPLTRSLTISRTETLRAFRGATRMQYQANRGIVRGYVRRAAQNSATCPACIALDGTEHETADILPTHPACRCVAVPRVVSYRDLGLDVDEPERPVEGARDWFERQPAATQRATLGPGRFAAWREGRLALTDMATVRDNATWGPTVSVTPLMGR